MSNIHLLRLATLLISYLAMSIGLQAQEICDNLIDDDNDGLIDVFDPDCVCDSLGGFEYIPNGGFEIKSDCCTMLTDQTNCLENWEIFQGTPDLYDPNCLSDIEIQQTMDLFGIDFESNFINFGVAGSFSETFGTCLLGTLQAGELYIFECNYSQTDIFSPNDPLIANMTIYGFEDCSDLENHNYGDSPCDNSPGPIELASFFTNSFTNNEWHDLDIAFTPPSNIEAIMIRVNCSNQNSNNQGIFLSMDDLSIHANETLTYDDTISVNGNVCDFVFFLEVPDLDLYSYQWFFESAPIVGETNASIQLNGQNPFAEGLYSIAVYHPDGCAYYEEFQLVIPTIDQEEFYTICLGDSVFVAGQYWDEAGDYTINYLDTISPCQILLEFHIDLYDNYEFITFDTICVGDEYEFQGNIYTEEGVYYDSLQTAFQCDSVLILQLTEIQATSTEMVVSICNSEPYMWEGTSYSESGYYTENYTNQYGCDSVLNLDLTFEDIISGDTLFIQLQEGEYYIFDGDTLTMEGIYQDTFSTNSDCDSIAYISILPLSPCTIIAFLEVLDASCSTSENGAIRIFPDIENENYQVSIDGGENFEAELNFENLPAGNYEIIIRDGVLCETNLGTVEIIALNDLDASITADTTIDEGGQVTLSVIQSNFMIESVNWTSSEESCENCTSLLVSPIVTTTYFATIIDENACEIIQEVTIFVRVNSDIYLPNIFTPNQDGINDLYRIFSASDKNYQITDFAIYDRWGNLVHTEQDVDLQSMLGWDGKMNGRSVSQGVYAYYLIYEDNEIEQIVKGSITLIR